MLIVCKQAVYSAMVCGHYCSTLTYECVKLLYLHNRFFGLFDLVFKELYWKLVIHGMVTQSWGVIPPTGQVGSVRPFEMCSYFANRQICTYVEIHKL